MYGERNLHRLGARRGAKKNYQYRLRLGRPPQPAGALAVSGSHQKLATEIEAVRLNFLWKFIQAGARHIDRIDVRDRGFDVSSTTLEITDRVHLLVDQFDHIGRVFIGDRARQNAALHEAGHVVIAVIHNVPVLRARVFLEDDEWNGYVEHLPVDEGISHGCIAIAGHVAEALFDPDFIVPANLEEIGAVVALVLGEAARSEAPARAILDLMLKSTIEDLRRNRASVIAISDALERERSLGRKAIVRLARRVKRGE